uniref:Uncharacterized protein n=1 Tax=Nelumbo nucifera TaxID=4432 RepID=A0A822ZU75_NELNU|nr:TPA_asm: hypothetical protein HUJ06_017008 [Nelumbo nucifera]
MGVCSRVYYIPISVYSIKGYIDGAMFLLLILDCSILSFSFNVAYVNQISLLLLVLKKKKKIYKSQNEFRSELHSSIRPALIQKDFGCIAVFCFSFLPF